MTSGAQAVRYVALYDLLWTSIFIFWEILLQFVINVDIIVVVVVVTNYQNLSSTVAPSADSFSPLALREK